MISTSTEPDERGSALNKLWYIELMKIISLALLLLPTAETTAYAYIPIRRPVCTSNGPFLLLLVFLTGHF
jgi:hypothetical protein